MKLSQIEWKKVYCFLFQQHQGWNNCGIRNPCKPNRNKVFGESTGFFIEGQHFWFGLQPAYQSVRVRRGKAVLFVISEQNSVNILFPHVQLHQIPTVQSAMQLRYCFSPNPSSALPRGRLAWLEVRTEQHMCQQHASLPLQVAALTGPHSPLPKRFHPENIRKCKYSLFSVNKDVSKLQKSCRQNLFNNPV